MKLDRWISRPASHAGAQLVRPETLLLPSRPQAPTEARDFVREHLGTTAPDVTAGHLDDVVLIVSELVTNAVRHATTMDTADDSLCLVIDTDGRRTRVEVHDPARHHPHMRSATTQDDYGRGLAIIDALCPGAWGVSDTPDGKAVWAVVKAS
ncbi:ATP-binding protein [Streptomyces sp. NPDC048436]|uniref:ATP-binding protein n=1 Tax=Streptomyces sp. NPDC048436 TaxID=3365550 RepID=UPI003718D6D7